MVNVVVVNVVVVNVVVVNVVVVSFVVMTYATTTTTVLRVTIVLHKHATKSNNSQQFSKTFFRFRCLTSITFISSMRIPEAVYECQETFEK